jgi:ankyrin repeat protein
MLLAKNLSSLTAWQRAAQKGHVGILKKLWELAKIYSFENTLLDIDTNTYTGLHLAVWKGQVGAALFLLEIGANVLAKLHDDSTVLHEAVLNNNIELITLILEAIQKQGLTGAVNAKDKKGNTPLMLAAEKGGYKATEVLLGQGADIYVKNKEYKTALDLAAEKRHSRTFGLLKREKPHLEDNRQQTPLDTVR